MLPNCSTASTASPASPSSWMTSPAWSKRSSTAHRGRSSPVSAEKALDAVGELAEALEDLAAGYPDPVLLLDRDGRVAAASAALYARSGLTSEIIVGSPFTQWAAPADVEL